MPGDLDPLLARLGWSELHFPHPWEFGYAVRRSVPLGDALFRDLRAAFETRACLPCTTGFAYVHALTFHSLTGEQTFADIEVRGRLRPW